MQINQTLIRTLRTVIHLKRGEFSEANKKAEAEALEAFLKQNRRIAAKLKQLNVLRKKVEQLDDELERQYGLSEWNGIPSIKYRELFRSKCRDFRRMPRTLEEAIVTLASMTAEQAIDQLKEWGIDWQEPAKGKPTIKKPHPAA